MDFVSFTFCRKSIFYEIVIVIAVSNWIKYITFILLVAENNWSAIEST